MYRVFIIAYFAILPHISLTLFFYQAGILLAAYILTLTIRYKLNDTRRYISDDRIRNGSERKANQEPQ